ASELNTLDGITATTTELNYVDGVTSGIQTQLNAKLEDLSGLSTDDLTEGSSNLYSQWEEVTVATETFITPKNVDQLLIGDSAAVAEIQASLTGASGIFADGGGAGVSYFAVSGIGVSFVPLGGMVVSTGARGTPGSEEALPASGVL